jgi:hypothetical protein
VSIRNVLSIKPGFEHLIIVLEELLSANTFGSRSSLCLPTSILGDNIVAFPVILLLE